MATVEGLAGLQRRLKAIGDTKALLHTLQVATVSEAQALVPRKTGHLQRSIRPGALHDDYAIVEAKTPYAAYVEKGTGLYGPKKRKIVPRQASVLAWKSSGTRLSGRSRIKGGRPIAGMAFARSVRGRKATPYLIPGARKAVGKSGIKGKIVAEWNGAA
jgi:hypothetical protein